MKKNLICAAALSLLCGCGGDSISLPVADNMISISASLAAASTRIAISDESSDGSWSLSWVEDDALGGFAIGSEQSNFGLYEMDSYHPTNSTFEGADSSSPLRFVYPYSAEALIADSHYSVDLGEQRFDMESQYANMPLNTHLISTKAITTATESSISMQHVGCAITLNFSIAELYNNGVSCTYKLARVEIGIAQDDIEDDTINYMALPTACDIALEVGVDDSDFYSNYSEGVITVDIDNSPDIVDGQVYPIVFNSLPFTVAPSEELAIKYYLYRYNLDGTIDRVYFTKDHTVVNGSGSSIDFARATHNTINAAYSGSLYFSLSITAGL